MTQPTAATAKLSDRNDNLQVADRGASVTALTLTGTYASDFANIQTAVNALIERLEAHGLIADN